MYIHALFTCITYEIYFSLGIKKLEGNGQMGPYFKHGELFISIILKTLSKISEKHLSYQNDIQIECN